MFRKIITNLAYSPALAGELTAYATRLRSEETKRQIGIIFICLALLIQFFAVFFPPESANAGNSGDFVEGGVSTADEYLRYYDQDARNIKDLLTSLGITRTDIQATTASSLKESTDLLLWRASSRGDGSDAAYDFSGSDHSTETAFYHTLSSSHATSSKASPYPYIGKVAFVGNSDTAGWFAILKDSGNLLTTNVLSIKCPFGPGNEPIAVSLSDTKRCGINLTQTLSANNITTGTPAMHQEARASDRIMYTLAVKNNDSRSVSSPISLGIADILEYAQLMDKGGANFDEETKSLVWSSSVLSPNATLTRSFIVKLSSSLPSTAIGKNNLSSYDCILGSSFGQTMLVPVACPFPKIVERTTNTLPRVSAQFNVLFAAVVLLIATYFYVRARQIRTELRVIRHNYHGNI